MNTLTKFFCLLALLSLHGNFVLGDEIPETLKINDPTAALEILKAVEVHEPIPPLLYNEIDLRNKDLKRPFLGLVRDNGYCDKQREYFVNNPHAIAGSPRLMADAEIGNNFIRDDILPEVGVLAHPEVHSKMKDVDKEIVNLDPSINLYADIKRLYQKYLLDQQFGCLYQEYGRIPGMDSLESFDLGVDVVRFYGERYADKPQCFNPSTFAPKSWNFNNITQCKEFFDYANSGDYQNAKKQYDRVVILKDKQTRSITSVWPLHNNKERKIRIKYDFGKKCKDHKMSQVMAQQYIQPTLIKNRQFELITYILVASTNPHIAYFNEGLLRISIPPYDPSEKNSKKDRSTYQDYVKKIKKGKDVYNLTAEELEDFRKWDLYKLQAYLLEEGKINDQNWVENTALPQLKKAAIHLTRAAKWTSVPLSQLFEAFQVTFIMGEDLNFYFLIYNPNPKISPVNDFEREKFKDIFRSIYDIQMAYLRSRVKRVVSFVNKVDAESKASGLGLSEYLSKNDETLKKEFANTIQNRLEPEYQPSEWNKFTLVLNEGETDVQKRFAGLLTEECLNRVDDASLLGVEEEEEAVKTEEKKPADTDL